MQLEIYSPEEKEWPENFDEKIKLYIQTSQWTVEAFAKDIMLHNEIAAYGCSLRKTATNFR